MTALSFQSTPSAWRETADPIDKLMTVDISIHSLRMEGDLIAIENTAQIAISIHSLRMEGDHIDRLFLLAVLFISIHSLRMEGDCHG